MHHNIFSYFRRVTESKPTPHVEGAVPVVEDAVSKCLCSAVAVFLIFQCQRSPHTRNSKSGLFGFLTRICQVCHPVPELWACLTCESRSGLLLGFHLRGTNVVTLRVGRIMCVSVDSPGNLIKISFCSTHCHHHALKYLKLMGLQTVN